LNDALDRLARELDLDAPANERLRFEFALACVQRVEHLLEEPAVLQCLRGLADYLAGSIDRDQLDQLATDAARLANQHQGSRSLDGVGHAAVSATYAVANALAGKARRAAEYAAYAMVYGQGGYGAVADRESFEPEFAWQVDTLRSLAGHCARRRVRAAQGLAGAGPQGLSRPHDSSSPLVSCATTSPIGPNAAS
jgi:hypothetical protein